MSVITSQNQDPKLRLLGLAPPTAAPAALPALWLLFWPQQERYYPHFKRCSAKILHAFSLLSHGPLSPTVGRKFPEFFPYLVIIHVKRLSIFGNHKNEVLNIIDENSKHQLSLPQTLNMDSSHGTPNKISNAYCSDSISSLLLKLMS